MLRAAVAATALLLAAGAVRAQSCTLTTVSGVSFGSYDALETGPLDQTGSVTFECDVPVTVDVSTGSSGTFAFREMRNGGHSLRYNLFLDATRSQIWGDGTSGSSRFGPALPQTLTIYGRIPARQTSPVGSYTDTVTATINF